MLKYNDYYSGAIDYKQIVSEIVHFSGAIEFDPKIVDALKLHDFPDEHKVFLNTSGSSTGVPKKYSFSDIRTLMPIEYGCKYPHGKGFVIQLYMDRTGQTSMSSRGAADNEPHFDHYLVFSDLSDSKIKFIISELSSILEKQEKIILWNSDQNNLMYLASDHHFYHFMIENANRISLLNTGITAFFKQNRLREAGVHINDNMIDWYSGLNFYTCRHNNKHILPMFFMNDRVSTNLLNLSRRGEMVVKSDYFDISPSFMCQCGKMTYNLRFIPHKRVTPEIDNLTMYMPDIAEMIVGSYYNMQFVQTSEKDLEVHYTGQLINYDREIIEHHCEPFEITFKPDSVFNVNHKQPIFHRVRSNRHYF
jgi:hypothetical protein